MRSARQPSPPDRAQEKVAEHIVEEERMRAEIAVLQQEKKTAERKAQEEAKKVAEEIAALRQEKEAAERKAQEEAKKLAEEIAALRQEMEAANRKAQEEAKKVAELTAQEEGRKGEIAKLQQDNETAKDRAEAAEKEAEQLRLALQSARLRFSTLDDLTDIDYRPIAKFVTGFPPTKGTEEYLRDTLQIKQLEDNCGPFLEDLLLEARKVAYERERTGVRTQHSTLDKNGLLAIVVFTLELTMFVPQATNANEFYVNYNQVLRERQKNAMGHLFGFTHYLVKGIRQMPPFSGTLWRGIEKDKKEEVEAKYTKDRRVIWNGFSSASSRRDIAKRKFAGPGGVLFRVEVDADYAWDIHDASALPGEFEKVILPNAAFSVEKEMHEVSDGMWEIHLRQSDKTLTF